MASILYFNVLCIGSLNKQLEGKNTKEIKENKSIETRKLPTSADTLVDI